MYISSNLQLLDDINKAAVWNIKVINVLEDTMQLDDDVPRG